MSDVVVAPKPTVQDHSKDTLAAMGTPMDIPLDELFIDHEFNHRGYIAPIDVVEFARALDRDGLLTPITVQPYSDPKNPKLKYRVVAGHRRSMAFIVLKRKTIPGFLKIFANELDARKESLIENIHRKDLNIKQEAHALKPFIDAFWGENDLAIHLNQSRGWVKIRMMLLTLPDKIQDIAAAGLITQEHIRQMYGKPEAAQYEFVRAVKEAKARGESLTIEKVVKPTNPHALKPRGREEIFAMITRIYEAEMPMGFWSRCLSWAAGQISEYDLMKDLQQWSIDNGKSYRVPNEMIAAQFVHE